MLINNVKLYPLSRVTDCIDSNIKVRESIFRMDTRCTNGRLMRTIPLNFQAASLSLCVTTPIDERSTTRIKSWTFLRQQNSPTLPSHVTSSFPTFFPQVLFQPFEDTAVAVGVAYLLTLDSFFLSDPSPIIGNACQWLTHWLTHSLIAF